MLPQGFVYLSDTRILLEMAYATSQNFVGRKIQDYLKPVCIMTQEAHDALIQVQNALDTYAEEDTQYRLKIFDAYRPVNAVNDFKQWSLDESDIKMKDCYYPDFNKRDLFTLGYIAEKSGHSRGSTVDLTIVKLQPNSDHLELDMGTAFDFFGELSHTLNPNISETAKKNRLLLKTLMEEHGFENYHKEWWHFTLKNEPFKDQYFNFPIK